MYKKLLAYVVSRFGRRQIVDLEQRQYTHANALFAQGKHDAAVVMCRQVLSCRPDHFDSILLLAEIAVAANELEQALELYGRATRIDPENSRAHYKNGNALKDSGQLEAALASYERAAALDPRHGPTFCNRGVVLQRLSRVDAALLSYDQAIAVSPDDCVSHFNRAVLLRDMGRLGDALASYSEAISLSPTYAEALYNRGMLLSEQGEWDAALVDYDKAVELDPGFAEAHARRGDALVSLKNFAAAIASYDKAIGLKPTLRFVLGMRLHAKMQVCDWSDLDADTGVLLAGSAPASAHVTPFTILTLTDCPPLQHLAAKLWVDEIYPADDTLASIPHRDFPGKIRLGYFSSDYCEHPVARLAAQFLELHDRSNFEVIGFSLRPNTQDSMRQRLEGSFDQFFDVCGRSDLEVALLARSLGIDIAIDLNGHTAGSRTRVFALRAAPVQIHFLGFPGTTGAEYIDYMVGDPTVIPEDCRQHYSEKILYLPDSFLPHDSGRAVTSRRFTREQLGLPPGAIVFCCFNNSYKIMPRTFESWMKILSRVEDSVLWLSNNNATAAQKLQREAQSRGVDPRRLIFAERMASTGEHLARLQSADLFLDTLPYNAHATALDALWSGLPLLTCIGQGFAGRVAASLLRTIDLAELITTTAAQYEDLAVDLALDPPRLAAIRLKLEHNRLSTPLFDTARFTRNLERAYSRAFERYQAGLPPEHLYIE
jgi:protein O-GlcNAc transferase